MFRFDLTGLKSSDKIEVRTAIISLIFIAVLYILFAVSFGFRFAGSFLFGAGASVFDVYALTRLLRMVFATGAGWLFVPLGVFRWGLVGTVLFAAFYFYKAEPLPLLIGVSVPFVCMFLEGIYKLFWGNKNGASS